MDEYTSYSYFQQYFVLTIEDIKKLFIIPFQLNLIIKTTSHGAVVSDCAACCKYCLHFIKIICQWNYLQSIFGFEMCMSIQKNIYSQVCHDAEAS